MINILSETCSFETSVNGRPVLWYFTDFIWQEYIILSDMQSIKFVLYETLGVDFHIHLHVWLMSFLSWTVQFLVIPYVKHHDNLRSVKTVKNYFNCLRSAWLLLLYMNVSCRSDLQISWKYVSSCLFSYSKLCERKVWKFSHGTIYNISTASFIVSEDKWNIEQVLISYDVLITTDDDIVKL